MTDTIPGRDLANSFPEPEETPPPRRSRRRLLIALLAVLLVGLAALGTVFGWYVTRRRPLSQLPGISRDTLPHYLFSMYGSTQPLGVALSPDGQRVYVTETGGERVVRVYDRSGKQVSALHPPASTGAAHVPVYVAVRPDTQEVYVSDRATGAVYVYGPQNDYRRTFAPPSGVGSWAPLGLAFDPDGRLYVSDVRAKGGHRILVFGPDGALLRSLTPPGGMQFPNGIAVDAKGNVQVCDSNNARVLIFSPTGGVTGRITSSVGDADLGLPRGAAIDDRQRLYVADAANHAVRLYRLPQSGATAPAFIGSFGTEGTVDAAFEYPNGVAVDSRARVYVTDRENNRVQVWGY
jgi:DNA-binding beta-propeller fold protein YncE